ncbi:MULTISPECIES: hypothetical protein [unclassified Isoptericola]|uniref:hypothetical protein n=1 Tax=Isoptericola sp. NPDC057191 TaxID=3346041 RepID=UPI0036446C7F
MDSRSRRRWFVTALVLFLALSAGRLALTVSRDGVEGATVWIALLVVAIVVVVTLAVLVRRAEAVRAHVTRLRPGAVVVPAFTTGETLDEARRAGARTHGIAGTGGSPAALAVADGAVEVWVGREEAPRWVVRRVPGGVTEARADYGSRAAGAVRVSDGAAAVTVVPAYRPLRAAGGAAREDLARAVQELTAAP